MTTRLSFGMYRTVQGRVRMRKEAIMVSLPACKSCLSLTNHLDLMVESLQQFISYRTVSSLPKYRADCRRGASFLRSVFQNFGATTEMLNTTEPYNPIVFAKFKGNP